MKTLDCVVQSDLGNGLLLSANLVTSIHAKANLELEYQADTHDHYEKALVSWEFAKR